jgi:hypothetical protein
LFFHHCLLVVYLLIFRPLSRFCVLLAVHIFDVHRDVGCHICSRFLGKCYEGEYYLLMDAMSILYMNEFVVPSIDL